MDHSYISGGYIGYGDQTYWLTSTAMARNTSRSSDNSNYSESSNGQYDVAQSPSSESINQYDFLSVADAGAYITDGQEYDDTNNQVEDIDFQYQYYDFDTGGDSGQGPHWKLKSQYTPSTGYPAIISVGPIPEVPRSASDASGKHVCLEPYCNASPFKRKADLQRHYLHRHRDPNQKRPFPCDWKKCQRSKEPFYRLDHCREHYRDYHNEDLLRRGSNKESSEWWDSRNVDPKWWRCAKCLSRISIDSKRFECPKCKTTCEPERRKLRGYK
ncbi:hypothetical protein F4781DRAFT_328172 [Annulohypoxylon bovei var. microspora]|nr:hypothetical protein F4781DRAFT_328172 [Annulohypoxylon bovei var. microspora]